jgi:hypothetical protein
MVIANQDNADACHFGQVQRAIIQFRQGIVDGLEHEPMATVQIKRKGAVQVAVQRMEPAGQLPSKTEIVDCGKVIETATKLPG